MALSIFCSVANPRSENCAPDCPQRFERRFAAAIQKDVGDGCLNLRPLRNCKEVVLAPGPGNFDEESRCQSAGIGQNRPGNFDFGMAGQFQRQIDRRVRNRRNAFADFRQRSGFDDLDQSNQDLIEDSDLLFVQAVRLAQEQIRDLPQHGSALFQGTAPQRNIEILEQEGTIGVLHDCNPGVAGGHHCPLYYYGTGQQP